MGYSPWGCKESDTTERPACSEEKRFCVPWANIINIVPVVGWLLLFLALHWDVRLVQAAK